MGVFGFAEIIRNLEMSQESRDIVQSKIKGLMPTRQDLIDSSGAIARGTILGSILGILPGGGAVVASFAAYTFEKRISKTPERFGRGEIRGVAAPEAANNAAAQTSFIPLLTLGIPPNAVMALMVGAMTIHGIVPGPQVMTKQPELFWGMTDALITNLAQSNALKVISSTSSMRYKNPHKGLPEIGRELNVGLILEGSVARSGSHVRVSAQLVDAGRDEHLWARQYDRDLRDVLQLQNEIASAVALEVTGKLTSLQHRYMTLSLRTVTYFSQLIRFTIRPPGSALQMRRHSDARSPSTVLSSTRFLAMSSANPVFSF